MAGSGVVDSLLLPSYSDGMLPTLRVEEIAARLLDLPQAVPDLELLVLFGSHATARAGVRSDVDLAVRCTGAADLEKLYLALAPRLGTDRLDVIDLRRASPLLAFEVARSGRVLFE